MGIFFTYTNMELVSKWLVSPKRLAIKQNGLKFGTLGDNHTGGTFDLVMFKVVLGSFGTLPSKWS